MDKSVFTEADVKQMAERGITRKEVLSQLGRFKRGFPPLRLLRPCTKGDGIIALSEHDLETLVEIFAKSASMGRAMKFVPASGAASRMVKLLLYFYNNYDGVEEKKNQNASEKKDPDHLAFINCMNEIKRFAFYDHLKAYLAKDGLDIDRLLSRSDYKPILEYILTPKGLNYAHLPKGLITFHSYPDHPRTPFEEHMVEASACARDREGRVRLHFTISVEHENSIREHINRIRSRYEKSGVQYALTFSGQKASTDTIASDTDNKPFRDGNGRLLFRPGGHGALLENLYDLKGDIIFVKNIDNVVPDRLKQETFLYKKALGGYLIKLQSQIFEYLALLSSGNIDESIIEKIFEFARYELLIIPPDDINQRPVREKIDFLIGKLNRPLRVCGMVKKEKEPGGGPFWVEGADKTPSVQIVESDQVDKKSAEQQSIWESSTHFNPVDLVCGVRDYRGRIFDLANFTDPDTGLIAVKSFEGRELKALELPGLWNGAMANWISLFVEVPLMTFNPVKTILDLLRKEHQPA